GFRYTLGPIWNDDTPEYVVVPPSTGYRSTSSVSAPAFDADTAAATPAAPAPTTTTSARRSRRIERVQIRADTSAMESRPLRVALTRWQARVVRPVYRYTGMTNFSVMRSYSRRSAPSTMSPL